MNRCSGYLVSQITSCLCNMHIEPRHIWLMRHGQSEDNAAGLLGGDSHLTPAGTEFSKKMAEFIAAKGPSPLLVWTSTLVRTRETAATLRSHPGVYVYSTPLLNEIDAGMCEGVCSSRNVSSSW